MVGGMVDTRGRGSRAVGRIALAGLLLGGACADDEPGTSGTASSSGGATESGTAGSTGPGATSVGPGVTGADTTEGPATTSVPDGTSTGAATNTGEPTTAGSSDGGTTSPVTATDTGGSSGGGSSGGGSSGGGSSSDGGPACGNGAIDPGEQCDGADLQGFDCFSLGLGGGVLSCDPTVCTFDTSMCIIGGNCGNGAIDPGEQCDGADLQGFDCNSLGLGGGVLACDPALCIFDVSGCNFGGNCGNGAIDPGEQCDGADLMGFDCVTLGFVGGALGCDPITCTFDTSMCMGGGGTSG